MKKICGKNIDQIKKETSYYDCIIDLPYTPEWCPDNEDIRADDLFPYEPKNVYFENCTFQGNTCFCFSSEKCEFVNCSFSGKLLLFLWNDQRPCFKGCESAVTDLIILRNKKSKYLNLTLDEMYKASYSSGCRVLSDIDFELFTSLTKIRFLKLKYSSLPSVIFLFPNLEEIDLSHCGVQEDFFDVEREEPYLSLKKLNLSHNNFYSWYGISHFPSLIELDMSYNEIQEISEDIKSLVSLEKLNLRESFFSSNKRKKMKELLPECSIIF
ncbi:hypothetical protein [Candidatus Uabimicrobium sp. HlEnr_7]|uniref:hypothetical protein n=1 Tax=Candidatus Uabimicrobium helgolandensis TaxID=3095367 RepID=UPI0035565850